ncbi:NUDIX domain-containing protein [Streptomyces gamaensis]|uniref:NUDIX domain-containing protein n=1 Tax=Streptomyces gamaensis TaxID=1763542 RepID=A0ABW0YRM5_9ACTN
MHADALSLTNPPPLRAAAMALIVHPADTKSADDPRTLMLSPTDTADTANPTEPSHNFRLPAGPLLEGEPPSTAVARTVRTETGLEVSPTRLLVLDWIPPTGTAPAGIEFVYAMAPLTDEVEIRLPGLSDSKEPAFLSHKWVPATQLDDHCMPHQERQLRAALAALINGDVTELHYGEPACTTTTP